MKVFAKKALGQHFLTDQNIAQKIVEALDMKKCKSLVEIGPGTGMLTKHLINLKNIGFYAIDLDKESIDYLKYSYSEHKDSFIYADFLKWDMEGLAEPVSFIGNLPYYISSQILFKLLEEKNKSVEMVCMLQKEVAERIASPPGSKKYGILSVLLQTFYDIEYLFTVHEKCFSPPPNVKSAVIKLKRNKTTSIGCSEVTYKKVIKSSFNQRRKVLRNSLKAFFITLPSSYELLNYRPEQLSVQQFIELTRTIERQHNK